ncbi:MAG: sensor histidine kinase [Brevundimonas sp.]|nr:sensor histidine kinase [Brevundimonas sp.]
MQTSSFSEPRDAVRAAHHQIGNSLQSVASLLSLQGREAEPRTATALFEASRRVHVIMRLHQRLQTSGDDTVCLDGLLADVARDVAEIAETPRDVMLRLDLAPMEASSQTASALALIAAELVGNALEHAFVRGGGEVRVDLVADDGGCRLSVRDDGVGKGGGDDFTPGFGLRLIDRLVRQMHGSHQSATGPIGTLTTIRVSGPTPDDVMS